MSFLKLKDKTILINGIENKKSVAFYIGKLLKEEGANCIYLVKDNEI